MSDLAASIRTLEDGTAERILATVAKHRLQPTGDVVTALTPELAQVLTQATGETPSASPATPGELARTTLLLLAEDPARQAELQALVRNPPAEKFAVDPLSMSVLTTAALVALQMHVKIEYDKQKGWRVKLEKPTADKSLLGKVIDLLKHFAGS
jgi:hypothetical protein